MGLESATYIDDLDSSNPTSSDQRKQGDDHLRLIKSVLKNTFPNADKAFRLPDFAAKTSAYTVVVADNQKILGCDATSGAFTITLPVNFTSTADGFTITIVKTDSSANAITVAPASGTIQGKSSFTIVNQYTALKFVWTGTDWLIVTGALFLGKTIKTVTASVTLTTEELGKLIVLTPASADITVTLPSASSCSQRSFMFKRVSSSFKTTLDANASETIDGATTLSLDTNYDNIEIYSTGTEWLQVTLPVATGTEVAAMATRKAVTPASLLDGIIKRGTAIASATTITVGNGGHFALTGTTDVEDINFTGNNPGRTVTLRATGNVRLLTTGNIVTPTGAAIYLRAGDIVTVMCDNSSAARIVDVQFANSGNGTPDVIIEDQKAQNTSGGTSTTTDSRRDLNTLVLNNGTLATLSGNKFTLPAGKYYIEWEAPSYASERHQSWLVNETDSVTAARGTTEFLNASVQGVSRGATVVTITASKEFGIFQKVTNAQATNGWGVAANMGTEIYTRVKIWRIL